MKKKITKKKVVKKKLISPQKEFDMYLNALYLLAKNHKVDFDVETTERNGKLMELSFKRKEDIDTWNFNEYDI